MNAPPPSTELRERLLSAMLDCAPSLGWGRAGMAAAAIGAGMTPGEAELAAPGGAVELADAFALAADDAMAAALATAPLAGMKVRARVTFAVRTRIEALSPRKEAVRRAARRLAAPDAAGTAARIAWRTADRIWAALGDRSTDENYYSKRAILAGVHAATLARWLADADPAAAQTWAFLDARIENVMQFEILKARLKPLEGAGEAFAGMVSSLRYGRMRG